MSTSYHYKTTSPAVLEAVRAWDEKLKAFHGQREAMTKIFGGPGSPMYSGNDKYVGGVKISASRDLDVHWCRPDDHGYRSLRTAAKIPKGTPKEARPAIKAEHEQLKALWLEHCPARISADDTWKAIGLDWGAIWLSGGCSSSWRAPCTCISDSSSAMTATRSKAPRRSWQASLKLRASKYFSNAKPPDPRCPPAPSPIQR
ncbi:hypothetical protein [Pseudomonas shirazensis]